MGWYIPYHKLDSEQSQMINAMINDLSYVHWVKGCAGTGKSTVLLNFAQQLKGLYRNESFCFITYTHSLVALLEVSIKAYQLQNIHVMTHTQFLRKQWTYDFVFLDEVQDISPGDLYGIRLRARYLFVAGDCEQSIYEQSTNEYQIRRMIGPKEHELSFMHRLTANVAKVAFSLFPFSKLIHGKESNTNGDTTVKLIKFDSSQDEYEWLEKETTQRSRALKPYAILFSLHKDIENFYRYLTKKHHISLSFLGQRLNYQILNQRFLDKGLNFCYLGNGIGDLSMSENKPIVYVMTIHSSKGLDFQGVFVPHLNKDRRFHWQNVDGLEQRMLFVATTRTRQDLFLTYTSDEPHELLKQIPKESLVHHKTLLIETDEDEDEDFF